MYLSISTWRVLTFIFLMSLVSCDRFLSTDLDTSQVVTTKVFSDELNATSAVLGMYSNMLTGTFAAGGSDGISSLTGLSSDEFNNYMQDPQYLSFELNDLNERDLKVENLWSSAYRTIYQANDILEELSAADIGESVKNQLTGEALFVRAFAYFYLVNLFGDVPLVLSTSYDVNSKLSREKSENVYDQIQEDLRSAKLLLTDSYVDTERVRPNRAAASALLSRVYLYRGAWQEAAAESTEVIDNSIYTIGQDLSAVFLKESEEVIWQLASDGPLNTLEGYSFVILYGPGSGSQVISDELLNSFEEGDNRFLHWVGTYTDSDAAVTLYFPYKYKAAEFGLPISEYFIVFRLAEQYLIRAEAYANIDKMSQSIQDLDVIRERAGLQLIGELNPEIGKDELLKAIAQERRIEFLGEWGHRWFDLKRTSMADEILSPLKSDWSGNDDLYPIPLSERDRNPGLRDAQNPGY